jgi:hypothetical protein
MSAAASPDDRVDGVARAVGVQLHEHVAQGGQADDGLFRRGRITQRGLGQPVGYGVPATRVAGCLPGRD